MSNKGDSSGRVPEQPARKAIVLPEQDSVPYVLVREDDWQGTRKRRRSRGCMGWLGIFSGPNLILLVILLVVIVVVQGLLFWGNPFDEALSWLGFERDSKPEIVDSQILVLGIRDLALLQTASGDVRIEKQVVDTGPSPDAKLRMSYIGSVAVGIDLTLFDQGAIVVGDNNRLTVSLPPIQILDCALREPEVLNSSCTEIPFVQDCDDIRTRMEDAAYTRAMEDLLRRAEDGDITTTSGDPLMAVAYSNAERAIADLLGKLGYESISFVRSDAMLPPAETCTP